MYNKKVKFDYDVSKFVDCEYPDASSCVKHQVHELTDIHDKYGGFPKTYKLENTTIHQRWWNKDELDFDQIGSLLNMHVVTISSIKQPPGQVVPWHRDTFFLLKKEFPDRPQPVRALIMLEDCICSMHRYLFRIVLHDSHSAREWRRLCSLRR